MTDYLILADYETTGLSEDIDVPVELGIAVVDRGLEVIDSMQRKILIPGWEDKLRANPYVLDMHTKSGLYKELCDIQDGGESAHKSRYRVENIEQEFLHWLNWESLGKYIGTPHLEYQKYPITGSSIHFDRKFMEKFMPSLARFFTHRNHDVSSLKESCKFFNPSLYAKLPKQENKVHRPLADIEMTLAELRWYRDNFLWTEGE